MPCTPFSIAEVSVATVGTRNLPQPAPIIGSVEPIFGQTTERLTGYASRWRHPRSEPETDWDRIQFFGTRGPWASSARAAVLLKYFRRFRKTQIYARSQPPPSPESSAPKNLTIFNLL